MDVKRAFLYGKIKEEVYVCQPLGFEDPNFPNRVYKVEKALYGLHQAPRAWYETLSTYLLDIVSKKKIGKTFIHKRLQKAYRSEDYKHTNGNSKAFAQGEDGEEVDAHMYRSMIGSLMYLTSSRPDIMFVVCAYARYQVNPKVSYLHVVKRIFRYLKGQPKLGLWYLKDSPFDLVAYTDSDYARASLDRKSTIGGINLLLLLKVNAARHNLLLLVKVNAARHNLLLLVNVNVVKEQFWANVKVKTVNGEVQLQALMDGKKIIKTESTMRRDLQLEDAKGVDCLPNLPAFSKNTGWNEFSSTMASAIICIATNQKFTFSKYIFESMVKNLDNASNFFMYPRVGKGFSGRETPLFQIMVVQDQAEIDNVADEAVNEEMDDSLERAATTATSLDAEKDNGNINKTQSKATPNEAGFQGTIVGSSRRVESSKDEGLGEEDVSKQGMIADIDADEDITLVNDQDDADMFGVNDLDALAECNSAKPKAVKVVIQEPEQELAFKLQAEEEERLSKEKAQQTEEANIAWDDIQAKIEVDYKLAQRLQAQETELVEESSKKAEVEIAQESSSKRAGDKLEQENAKKKKVDEDKETTLLQSLIEVVLDDEDEVAIDAIPLATKPPTIVD
ncbi:putative ribonuclease H-like domain-containing protein [Tanacetum coccineum]